MKTLSVEAALLSLRRRLKSKQLRDRKTGCLLFTGARSPEGYGELSNERGRKGQPRRAHRVAAFIAGIISSLDDPRMVLHRCDNPSCTEPAHLYAGNGHDNMRDKTERGRYRNQNTHKTHCIHGHALEGYNILPDQPGHRRCRTCNLANNKAWRARVRKAATSK